MNMGVPYSPHLQLKRNFVAGLIRKGTNSLESTACLGSCQHSILPPLLCHCLLYMSPTKDATPILCSQKPEELPCLKSCSSSLCCLGIDPKPTRHGIQQKKINKYNLCPSLQLNVHRPNSGKPLGGNCKKNQVTSCHLSYLARLFNGKRCPWHLKSYTSLYHQHCLRACS